MTRDELRRRWAKALRWAHRRLPTGTRLLVGLLLMIGGVFGFLPVVGFWMFPLGVAIASLDVRIFLRRRKRRRRLRRAVTDRDAP